MLIMRMHKTFWSVLTLINVKLLNIDIFSMSVMKKIYLHISMDE